MEWNEKRDGGATRGDAGKLTRKGKGSSSQVERIKKNKGSHGGTGMQEFNYRIY